MENKKRKILIVEDDKIDRMAFERFANEEKLPYNYIFAESVKEAKKFLEKEKFDAVLLDYRLGNGTAFDLFDKVETFPFIIVTGTGDEEIAVKAMKSGAYDYLIKDDEGNYLKILPVTVENAIKHKLAEEANKRAEEELQKRLGELEIYYRATIGRESRIIELKHQVNELLERLGEKTKYKV
jgi:DNA-binding NtrC family response regulator